MPRHWEQLSNDLRYAYPALKRIIKKQAETILKAAKLEQENLMQLKKNMPIINKIIKVLEQNINRVAKQFDI